MLIYLFEIRISRKIEGKRHVTKYIARTLNKCGGMKDLSITNIGKSSRKLFFIIISKMLGLYSK